MIKKEVQISIIAAIGKNRELGKDNKLLWHIPEDLKRFRKLTQGHAVIMGRKTFESIGKPLPNRLNIIVTRDIDEFINLARHRVFSVNLADSVTRDASLLRGSAENTPQSASRRVSSLVTPAKLADAAFVLPNLFACNSLIAAIRMAKKLITENEVFIIGGGQIYQQAIPYADKLYLTIINGTYDADTFFPDYSEFNKLVFEQKSEGNGYRFRWIELERSRK